MSSQVVFSAHARSRMARRTISEKQVRTIISAGNRLPEPAAPGAAARWRYAGRMEGKVITVIVAQERDALIVITAY